MPDGGKAAKKARERAAVELLYAPGVYSATESERPDFIVTRPDLPAPFGVEVTDLFDSEVAARLDRIPDYALSLIDGGAFRHKDDAAALSVDDATFSFPEGKQPVTVRVVGWALPSFPEYLQRLEGALTDKQRLFAGYQPDLLHVNLLIVDRSQQLSQAEPQYLYPLLFSESIRDAVAYSPFRELYLVTSISGGRQVCVPLRMYLLVGCVFQFGSVLELQAPEFAECSPQNFLEYLHTYLESVGIHTSLVNTDGDVRLGWGNAAVGWSKDETLVVHLMSESPLSGIRLQPRVTRGPWCAPAFHDALKTYCSANTLLVDVALDMLHYRSPSN